VAKIEIFKGEVDTPEEFYWRLKAANGEIVSQSEGYTTQEDAIRGAGDMLTAAAACIEVRHAAVPNAEAIFVQDDGEETVDTEETS
jgi:uncharacterized protein YegP (UPF0339 family)